MIERYIHCSWYYHHQIGSINLTNYYIRPWLCAWDVCYIIFWQLLHNCTSRENRDFVFIIIVQFMMSANCRIRFGLQIVFVCLYIIPSHYHHCANLSEDINPIKCQIYFIEYASKIRHIVSVIHYTIYGAVSFQFTHFPCDDFERLCTLSYYHHHQIGCMNYYPLFRVRSWNDGMCCVSIYILVENLCKVLIWKSNLCANIFSTWYVGQ